MSTLTPTRIAGRVVWLGLVRDRGAGLVSEAVERVDAVFEGFAGEAHGGLTRKACVRVKRQYPRGAEIRNARQISIVSVEDMAAVAAALGIEALDPRWLGANMVVEGIPDFSWVPPSSRLIFPSGAGIAVDTQNAPCRYPAQEIEKAHPGHGLAFPKRAEGRRGVVAWVERPGEIALGDAVALHVPPQRLYQPALSEA